MDIQTDTEWQNPAGCLICVGYFPQKNPTVSGSFAKRDLQLKASYASAPLCRTTLTCAYEYLLMYICKWLCLDEFLPCFEKRSFAIQCGCNTLQHTATHCNTLQHAATLCNTLQHSATPCNTLQHTATLCNTLQDTAAHCNTLQRSATHCKHSCPHSEKRPFPI